MSIGRGQNHGYDSVLAYTLTMEPDQNEDHLAEESVESAANPTPPQGIPRVVSAYQEADAPGETTEAITDTDDPHSQTEFQTVEEGTILVDDEGPVFDAEYQPDRTLPKRQREFPFWAWLAIPVALVLGIILVLVFGPLSSEKTPNTAENPAPAVAESGTADPSAQASRDPGSKDAPLPLATPAPPGKFRAVGLAVFSGPDDVQLNPGSVVTPDTRLTFRLSYTGAQLKDKVEVKWEVNDREWGSEIVHLSPWTTTQWFTRERPESGWPEGRYRLTVIHDDKEESSIFFEVNPTGQPADPATATFPADGASEGEPQGGAGGGVEGSTTESEFSFSRPSDSSSE